jgi:hypothetical protein
MAEAASVTVVEDREGDNFDQFGSRPNNVHLLARAAQNRLATGGGKYTQAGEPLRSRVVGVVCLDSRQAEWLVALHLLRI